jgi:striatin 1/3/4
MRFLQIEWHNHERARNAWAIERAEMKAKIAKQEGECRQAKRINEQLVKQIQMLQKALKQARGDKGAVTTGNGRPSTTEKSGVEKDSTSKKGVEGEDDVSKRETPDSCGGECKLT